MTRKTLVGVISLIYMVMGFSNFFSSLLPTVSPSGSFTIKVVPLVGGALVGYAGLTMFRLSEFGRKFVVLLLSTRVVINTALLLRLPLGGAGLGIENCLGELIDKVQSPYAYQVFLLALIVIGSLTIIFLSQRETKEIFMPVTTSDVKPDIILEE